MVGRSSESLTALGDQHLPAWGLLVEQRCKLLVGRPAAGVQRRTADFLVSDFGTSNGYSVSVSYPDASRA